MRASAPPAPRFARLRRSARPARACVLVRVTVGVQARLCEGVRVGVCVRMGEEGVMDRVTEKSEQNTEPGMSSAGSDALREAAEGGV